MELAEKRDQLRKDLVRLTSLWGIFLIGNWYVMAQSIEGGGGATPGQLVPGRIRKQAEKVMGTPLSHSLCISFCLQVLDFLTDGQLPGSVRGNKPFLPQAAFGFITAIGVLTSNYSLLRCSQGMAL